MPLPTRGKIEEANYFIETLPVTDERVVHEIPKEELNEIPMENDPAGDLAQDIVEGLKRKDPRTCTEILRCAMMAYATNMELEHQTRKLIGDIPQSPPPAKKLCVMIGRKFYEEIKQETLVELRKLDMLQKSLQDDDDDSSSDDSEAQERGEEDAHEEIKEFPMPLTFDFATLGCGQRLRVQLIVPSVFLELVAAQLEQKDVDQKKKFSFDDLVQLGRTKAKEVSLDYDRMLRPEKWIAALQNRCGVDWKEFPSIRKSLRDTNFGSPTPNDDPPRRPQARGVLLNGSRKVYIKMHQRQRSLTCNVTSSTSSILENHINTIN